MTNSLLQVLGVESYLGGRRLQFPLPLLFIYLLSILIFFKQVTVKRFKSANSRSTFVPHPGFPVHRNQCLCGLYCVLPGGSYTPAPGHTLGSLGKETQSPEDRQAILSCVFIFND